MNIYSFNVNGLRAILKKDFTQWVERVSPDILCLQETKLSDRDFSLDLPGYHQYYSVAEKKGYSGTAIFSKTEPLNISEGMYKFISDGDYKLVFTNNAMPDMVINSNFWVNYSNGINDILTDMKINIEGLNVKICGLNENTYTSIVDASGNTVPSGDTFSGIFGCSDHYHLSEEF